MNCQSVSMWGKPEEMTTPTATTEYRQSEEMNEGRKRKRTTILPTGEDRNAENRHFRCKERTEANKKCQPWPNPRPAAEEDAQQKDQERKHTTWEDIGLVEYNTHTTNWECRFGHCQQEMDTEKRRTIEGTKNIRNVTLGGYIKNCHSRTETGLPFARKINHAHRDSATKRKPQC